MENKLEQTTETEVEREFKQNYKNNVPMIIFFISLICVLILGIGIIFNKKINTAHNSSTSWAPYLSNVERKIKKNWHPPKGDSPKLIVTKFTIGKNGELIDVTITKSSNIKPLDDSALDAIKDSAPFEPLPKNYKGKSVPIEFTFDYNIIQLRK